MPTEHEHEHGHDCDHDHGHDDGGGAAADAATATDDAGPRAAVPASRILTTEELADCLVRASRGQSLTEEEAVNARAAVEALNNRQFSAVVQYLDSRGLQNVVQELYGGTQSGAQQQREIPVMCYRFWNAAEHVDRDVRRANTLYNPHNIFIVKTANRTISKADTERVVGHEVDNNFQLNRGYARSGGTGPNRFTHADMRAVLQAYVPKTVFGGLWAKKVIRPDGTRLAGTSGPEFVFGAGYHKLAAVATDHSGRDTFAHELGHVLFNAGHSGNQNALMRSGGDRNKNHTGADRITDEQARTARASALGWFRRASSGR